MAIIKKIKDYDLKHANNETCVVAFVQFISMHGKIKFYKTSRMDWFSKLFYGRQNVHKKFQEQWLDVRRAPEPEVILWENQHVTVWNRLWKWAFTLFLMAISLIAVLATLAGTQYYANKSTKDFDSELCGTREITQEQAYADSLLPEARQVGLLGCYCFNELKLVGLGIADILFPDKEKKCTEWLTTFTLNTSMTLVTAGVVEVVNEIVIMVLIWTSEF